MTHSTILITRPLTDGEILALRGKLGQLWPGERFTIMHGRVEVAERREPGPSEYKVGTESLTWDPDRMTLTPTPRFEE